MRRHTDEQSAMLTRFALQVPGDPNCQHQWGEIVVFSDLPLHGCLDCEAVEVMPDPPLDDVAALNDWLDS